MSDELRGKIALVTGAARGIGARIAARFAEAGATVYGADVGEGATLRLDVTDRAAVRAAVERISKERGAIDVLVNNAGVLTTGPFESTTGEQWDRLVAVNFTGIFNCVQAVVPAMQRGASIINMSSVSHEKGGGIFGNVWYGATKAGVVAMTRGLARELGPRGIRVNAIAPSVVGTDMVDALLTAEVRERILARIPLGRIAEPDDVARLALFLASEAASFITGETVAVDGGFLRT
ncbi:MAG TPA: SDR family NAD(P)-dependent oxidoreductase [Burkholderiales bacterium]|jgi:3-oxoacyl-[acyl-carrier protein] reductase|nr:SDR family NAD(P)-dependent oxidoreductase [Burkholderiales bacterium]